MFAVKQVTPMGSEQPTKRTDNAGLSNHCDAKRDARWAKSGPATPATREPSHDPELALISGVWSRLPRPVKAGIVAMVKATVTP